MNRAFSLVELSIVLVILGLLTGGILAGQSLIRASELRAVSTEISRFQTAIYSFRDKYFQLPGDFNNAKAFWGDDNSVCPDAAVTNGSPGACNGTGDGKIAVATNEPQGSWRHLSLAGLIEGTYANTGTLATAGVMPRSKFNNVYINYYWASTIGAGMSSGNDPNRFVIGALATAGATTSGAAFKPEENWNIDTKMDDGLPSQGKMQGNTGYSNSGTCLASSVYTLTNSGVACYFTYAAD